MIFESRNANIACVLSICTAILWGGPSRFIPGYKDSLPVAQTKQGLARGDTWMSRDRRYFSAFRGIPYAKQPVEKRRFRVTESLDEDDTWDGVIDFNRELPECVQKNPLIPGFYGGREDCLKLSVFSPDLKPESLLPVIVNFHGGGFVANSGSSSIQGPANLMDEDIVMVSINYRLGIFGFLSLENDDAPGNLGLWDQRMALVWVRNNIAYFGGDPEKVTIMGQSAGSMSVNYHLLSPQSQGLFHRAIMISGTALSTFTKSNQPPKFYAKGIAEEVGCGESHNILECLQALPAKTIAQHTLKFDECSLRSDLGLLFPGPWVPIVDDFASEPFLPAHPETLLKQDKVSKVPIMLGHNKEDGLFFTSRAIYDANYWKNFTDNWETCGPINILGLDKASITEKDIKFTNELVEKYNKKPVSSITPENLTDIITDGLFSTHKVSQHLVKGGNKLVFKYLFAYSGTTSVCDMMLMSAWKTLWFFTVRIWRLPQLIPSLKPGTCHADDIFYLFQFVPIFETIPSEDDQIVSRNMVRMWTKFAETGNPTIDPDNPWRPVHKSAEYEYFVIDKNIGMQTREEMKRLKHWD